MKNIIIIIVDAFRPKNTSMFGYYKETDTNMKKIAKESILFKEHFSSSNSTAPSLTSLFTGKFPNHTGIIHQLPYTKDSEMRKFEESTFWLPSFLREKGYETIAVDWIGLWFRKGFDIYEEKQEKGEQGSKFMNIPIIKKILLSLPSWMYKLGKKIIKKRATPGFPPASETMNFGISKLENTRKPFFLFMHFWDTHFPFPTTEYKAKGEKDIDKIIDQIKDPQFKDYAKKRVVDINLNSTEDMINKYDLAIKNIDNEIGKLYNFLKEKDFWKDTIFIVLGDHGDRLVEPGNWFSHAGLHDNQVHVPLIMHLPGIKSKELKGFVQNVDILPTILDYLGLKIEEKIDGKSMLSFIKSGKEIRDRVFSWDGLSEDVKSVRTKDRKLIIARDGKCNLCKSEHTEKAEEYDLIKDSEEKKNVYSGKSELNKFLEEEEVEERDFHKSHSI